MFFSYDFLLDENAAMPTPSLNNFDVVRIQNGIFNHLNILNTISTDTNEFDTEIPSWTDNTVMNATFNGTLNGGDLAEIIANIHYLAVQRQEVGSTDWITLQTIYKDETTGNINASFTMYDTYAVDGVEYIYQLMPYDINNNPGTAIQQRIVSRFNDAFIADADNIFKITNEYEVNRSREQVTAVYTPYGSKYPFVALNALTNYDSGSITAILLASTSEPTTTAYLDRKAQTALIDQFNTWLTNGRPKVLKDFNGELKIIMITNAVSNDYYKELGNGLASSSFDFVEVGEMTQEYLEKLGMVNKFKLYNNSQGG